MQTLSLSGTAVSKKDWAIALSGFPVDLEAALVTRIKSLKIKRCRGFDKEWGVEDEEKEVLRNLMGP